MTTHMQYPQAATLVVGLGKTGYSVADYLYKSGESFCIADNRKCPPMLDRMQAQMPDVEVLLGEFQADRFSQFETIIVSPGVSLEEPALREASRAGAELIGDVELFARQCKTDVLAITGSNGKSTVTQWVADVLSAGGISAQAGGNIGLPVMDLLHLEDIDLFVLELSSFQLESTRSLKPKSAVVLNICADHMDRYEDLHAYAAAKGRIYQGAGSIVVNRDDEFAGGLAGDTDDVIGFSLRAPDSERDFGIRMIEGREFICQGATPLLPVDALKLEGRHNLSNALAVLALISAAGFVISDAMIEGLKSFSGLAHRMELVANLHGIKWINDSKGTNVGATLAALEGINSPVVLIAGGQAKGADLKPLCKGVEGKARKVLLIGEDAGLLEEALTGCASIERCESLEHAVSRAEEIARPGDTVLFSPACASFDMFKSFEHRGDCFRALVEARAA